MLKVMGKGRRKVFNDVHIQRLPTFEHFFYDYRGLFSNINLCKDVF